VVDFSIKVVWLIQVVIPKGRYFCLILLQALQASQSGDVDSKLQMVKRDRQVPYSERLVGIR